MSGFKATKFAPKRAASKLDEDARKQVRLEKEADIPRINGQVPGEEVRFPLQDGESEQLSGLLKGERPDRMPAAIFCDCDGSVLDDDNVLTPRTIASLERYRAVGGIVVFTTGRGITSLRSKCAAAGFWPEVCIGTVGTTLLRPPDAVPDERLDSWLAPGTEVPFHVDSALAVDFLATFMERIPNCHAWVDLPCGSVGTSSSATASVLDDFRAGFSAQYPHRSAEPSLAAEILAHGETIPGVAFWVRGLGQAEMTAAMIAACKDDAQRELLASTYTIGPVGVNCNDGTHVVIIASKLSGKAGTLQWVCEHLGDGYEPQTVAAFGDGTNDTAMFAVAGWSCAPANGEPEAREKASAVSVLTNADAPVNFIAAQLDAFVEQQQ